MSKELQIRWLPNYALCEIYYEGGGALPKELSGTFTSKRIAEDTIKKFQLTVQNKVAKRGKTNRK
jgi:hypothetical protein